MIEKFYYKIHYKTPYRKALFIVAYRMINNNIKYLILKRKLHWKGWEFPKGGVELFETKKMGVKRVAMGIWQCSKCNNKFTAKAYSLA